MRIREAASPSDDAGDRRPSPFRVEVRRAGDAGCVTPVGDLDIATARRVEKQLEAVRSDGARRILLDLHEVTFMDSSGVHLALDWQAESGPAGVDFALIEGSPAVQRIFDLAGAADRLHFAAGLQAPDTPVTFPSTDTGGALASCEPRCARAQVPGATGKAGIATRANLTILAVPVAVVCWALGLLALSPH